MKQVEPVHLAVAQPVVGEDDVRAIPLESRARLRGVHGSEHPHSPPGHQCAHARENLGLVVDAEHGEPDQGAEEEAAAADGQVADLQLAARNIMWAKLANAGQTCIAPDHVYVHHSVKDEWVRCCQREIERAYGSSLQAQQASPHLARIVNTRHATRLSALLDDALARGTRVLAGGQAQAEACFVQPTLLDQAPADARVMREEIFGPLLPVIGFESIDEVIAAINAAPKPLALYIYSRTPAHIRQVLAQTVSGGACVNHSLVQFLHGRLPFGGVNHSGIGNAHGHYGFKAFSHERGVVQTQLPLAATLFAAGEVPGPIRKALRSALKWL